MSDTQNLNLVKGVQRGEKNLEQIVIRKPKAGDLRGLRMLEIMQGDVNSLAKLLPRITTPALTEQEVYQFDFVDMASVMEVMSVFIETST